MTQGQTANQPILITGTTNLSVAISDDTGYSTNIGTLRAEAYNGHSQIDIHEVIRSLFHEGGESIVNNTRIAITKDYNLSAYTHINGSGHFFTRGIKSPTGDFAILGTKPTSGEILRNTSQDKKTFSFYANISEGRIVSQVSMTSPEVTIYEGSLIGVFTVEAKAQAYSMRYKIYNEDPVTPVAVFSFAFSGSTATVKNPFLVRWINQEGGWETFMFECKQEHSKGLTKNESFQPFTEDTNPRMVSRTYSKEAKEPVEVSSGIIDAKQYDRLSVLPYSPVIQLYEDSEWKDIQIEKGDSAWMTGQTTGEIIFLFQLPQPKIMK